MRKVLIIEGMHRSGSSLITQWLNKCGLHIGENLMKPAVGNIEGHFEDLDFIKLHEEFLEAADEPDSGLTHHKLHTISSYHKEKLKAIINLKNGYRNQWGWKDPRTCLFFNTYRELLPDAYHLVLTRDFNVVVSSLINRIYQYDDNAHEDRKPLSKWIWKTFRRKKRQKLLYKTHSEFLLKVWIAYNEEILDHIKHLSKKQFIVVDYLSVIKNEKPVFAHIKNNWGFDLRHYDFKKVYKESLVSKAVDINPYIKDKTLIAKAKDLERCLNEYLFKPQYENVGMKV